ncbi:ATP-binding protein [Scytonema hofmannii FACHB-248]|uniref:ATP-binding protein n=1 Tax=Scytonema hofmannii FACHB-248 TaxID=1842502 RepID=A0ABR8GW56_9CYAN|nr:MULTISPECIES: ATP-binding protein [Nostocales]MBD2607736.1 ATP-binding protein [Scytonema hofmannii FACHB-248]
MAEIDKLIIQSLNPFDNSVAGNFWEEQQPFPTVESIHQKELTQIKSVIGQISQDHQTRSLILYGDSGSGKTHFMGQLKEELNNQAFFAYIGPFPQSDYIWQHVLRHTVDSLVNAPAGQADSQLILWLKSCFSTIQKQLKSDQQKFIGKIKGFFGKTDAERDRQVFIDILKKTIGTTGIYNANEFFGVLYDLTNPDLYFLACEWLKGDDLDEVSLKKLRVKQSIDDEDKAQGILGNFSKISAKTQPIVLCFDQLENIARLPDGSTDLQALFNINSTIHNGKWKNLLIIISIRTEDWHNNYKRVHPSDIDRATIRIPLKRITLEQGEALLATRLYPLHNQANPKPTSPIYPLNRQMLENAFLSRKATPRDFLNLGKQLYQDYKEWVFRDKQPPKPKWLKGEIPPPPWEKIKAEFELLWQQEYQKVQGKYTKRALLPAPDLIRMLQEALEALQVQEIKTKLISGKYANNSLSYQQSGKLQRVGVVWAEESNMQTFFNIMNACQTAIQQNLCQTLYLIRAGNLGNKQNVGNQLYRKIFTFTNHHHIKPDLPSVCYLPTYHSFVNSALANELVLAGKTITLQELQTLTRECNILQKCTLLQELKMVYPTSEEKDNGNGKPDLQPVKNLMLNLVKTQSFIGLPTLIKETKAKFSLVNESEMENLIQELCQEQKVEYFDPKAKPEDQLICLVTTK